MASPEQGKAKLVTVIHFPKLAGKVAATRRPTQSITELRAVVGVDEEKTDPAVMVTPEPKKEKPKGRRTRTLESPVVLPESHVADQVAEVKRVKTPQEAADLAAFGHHLFEMGRLEEARQIFEGLVSKETREAFVHTMLGTIYLALGSQDRALALFQAALKLDPDDLAAVVYRGEIRLNRGKLKTAMEDLMRAVSLAPASDPFVERARRLMKMAKALAKKKK